MIGEEDNEVEAENVEIVEEDDEVEEETAAPVTFNTAPQGCRYAGDDWVCSLSIRATGGSGLYIIFVDDSTYETDGGALHPVRAPRCDVWSAEITVMDRVDGNSSQRTISIDPTGATVGGMLGDGCTE